MDFIQGKMYSCVEYSDQMSDLPRLCPTVAARVADPLSFTNLSIDAPTVHLFKLIDCFTNFQYGINQFVLGCINLGLYI
jgi:hypothetical protein